MPLQNCTSEEHSCLLIQPNFCKKFSKIIFLIAHKVFFIFSISTQSTRNFYAMAKLSTNEELYGLLFNFFRQAFQKLRVCIGQENLLIFTISIRCYHIAMADGYTSK